MRKIVLLLILACGVFISVNCSNKTPTSANATDTPTSTKTPTPTKTSIITMTPTNTPALTYSYQGVFGQTTPSTPFAEPQGVAVSPDKKYTAISDLGNQLIDIFDQNGNYLYEIDPTDDGTATTYGPNAPYGMTFDDEKSGDYLFVADAGNVAIDVYQITSTVGNYLESYDGNSFANNNGYTTSGVFTGPMDVKLDNSGNLMVADNNNGSAGYTYNIDINADSVIQSSATSNDGGGLIPVGVAIDSAGNIYVSDQNNDYIFVYDKNFNYHYAFNGSLGGAWPSGDSIGIPAGIVVDSGGELIIADDNADVLWRTNIYGVYNQTIGSGNLSQPTYMAFDSVGNLYVADSSLLELLEFNP